MSVTFTAKRPSTVVGYAVTCYAYGLERDWRGPVHLSRDAACAEHFLEHAGNADCDGDYAHAVRDTDADPSVNVTNTNAATILDALGLSVEGEIELCGSAPAEEFLGRVLLALAVAPSDAGVPSFVETTPGRATVYHGGRPDGYLQQRLNQLHAVAEFASCHRVTVAWA